MKIEALLLVTLLTTSINCQQRTIKNCFLWRGPAKTCSLCYESKPVLGGCGTKLPQTDPCLAYITASENTFCSTCKAGFGARPDGTCAPTGIFNCVLGLANPSQCNACGSGQYPTNDLKACAPAPQGKGVANCLWGNRIGTAYGCYRCVPGFVVTEDQTRCVAETADTVGCFGLKFDGKTCGVCDAIAGYSMQRNLKCKFIKQ